MSFIYFYLLILVHPYIAMWWKSFPLAGRQSWEALIPVYNYFVAYRLFCRKGWWVALLIVPGVHLVMLAVLNTSYVRRFGYYSLIDTIQGIFFPYILFFRIAGNGDKILPETNWANSKEVSEREWGDHLALFLSLPVLGHIIALGIAAVTRQKPGTKTKVKEWGDSIIFALVAASIIRTYVFEPFRIPTGSMERTLLVGDFLFVNKLSYGPKVPITPLSYPLVHNTVPWINIQSYTTLEKGSYTRLPGFGTVQRNDVMVFNYPAGDTAVYDPRMPNGLMGHEYQGLVIDQAYRLYMEQSQSRQRVIQNFYTDSLGRLGINDPQLTYQLYNERVNLEFFRDYDKWLSKARAFIADGKTWSNIEGKLIEHKGIIYRPVDKRENYIKRCVGMPGDYIEIKDSRLFVNGKETEPFPFQNLLYLSSKPNFATVTELYDKLKIEWTDVEVRQNPTTGINEVVGVHASNEVIQAVRKKYPEITFEIDTEPRYTPDSLGNYTATQQLANLHFFPKDRNVSNNFTNFQKFQIPFKGKKVDFTKENIAWYRRIITAYEGHTLEEKADGIYIDGKKTTTYTVEMNYYWLMGDNRYKSADSRVWGFVPEDHVVGKASMIWFSSSSDYSGRWKRAFKIIE